MEVYNLGVAYIAYSGSEIRDQVQESIWILAVEFCKNPWILAI